MENIPQAFLSPICAHEISNDTWQTFNYLILLKEIKNIQTNIILLHKKSQSKYKRCINYNIIKLLQKYTELKFLQKQLKDTNLRKIKIHIKTTDDGFDVDTSENYKD